MSQSDRDRRDLLKGMFAGAVGVAVHRPFAHADPVTTPVPTQLVTVRDFGAAGDGRTDDTVALQRALDHGGLILLPAGNYCHRDLHATRPVILQGEGARTSVLQKTTPTSAGLTVSSPQVHLRDLGFSAAVTQTAGCFLHWTDKAYEVSLRDFTMQGAFVGVRNSARFRTDVERGSLRNAATGPGSCALLVDGGNDHYVRAVTTDNPADRMPESGIRVESTGCLNLTDCDIIHCGTDLLLRPTEPGKGVFSLFAVNCFFDTATTGLAIESASGCAVERCKFANCWFSSHTGAGLVIDGNGIIDTIEFTNCHVLFNAAGGADLRAGANLAIQDSTLAGNDPFGLRLGSRTADCRITGNKIGSTSTIKGHPTGILIDGATSHLVANNNLRGNARAIVGSFGDTVRLSSNLV